MDNSINEVLVDCKVIPPEDFKPKAPEQDMEIMRPLFNSFDELDYRFNQYNEKTQINIQKNRDINTAAFYDYYRVPSQGEEWSTLARWRYQNNEVYTRFMFWCFLTANSK